MSTMSTASTRARIAAFVVVVVVLATATACYALREAREVRAQRATEPEAPQVPVAAVGDGPRIVFRHTGIDRQYGVVAMVPLDDPEIDGAAGQSCDIGNLTMKSARIRPLRGVEGAADGRRTTGSGPGRSRTCARGFVGRCSLH